MTTANLSIQDNDTVDQYVSVGESIFAFTFPITAAAELKVSLDGQLLTYGVDWSLNAGSLNEPNGGSITITDGTSAGDIITLWLDLPIERESGYSAGAATLMPEDLNADAALIMRIAQMLRRDIGRALRLPVDDTVGGTDMQLPPAADRLGLFLRFSSSDGSPELAAGLPEDQVLSQSAIAGFLNPRTPAEIAGGLVVTNAVLLEGVFERYGAGAAASAGTNTTIMQLLLNSTIEQIQVQAGATYAFNARLTLASNKRIVAVGGAEKCTWNFPGVLGDGAGEFALVYGTGLTNVQLEGIHVVGDSTEFTNEGHNTYGVLILASSEVHLKRCSATAVENGLALRNGCSDCSIVDSEAFDCFYHSITSWGTSNDPNVRILFKNLKAWSTQGDFYHAAVSGVDLDYTFDSDVRNIDCRDVRIGFRLEHSGDNDVSHVRAYSCWQSGVILYNQAQRNNVQNVRAWDNNRVNQDAIDTTERGNSNTFFSGIDVSGISDNNNLSNVMGYQTPGTQIPFTSGSVQPWLGSLIRGATSGKLARVRRIELTSGTWGGGNAAGVLHCCEADGQFGAAEAIQNLTTRVPYNSGSAQPRPGDEIEGATSGATGTVLWASQQGDNTTDWDIGNSEGYLYLIDVTGTFDPAEDLDNTTTGQANFASTDGAADAEEVDIATTNGATTLGHANGDGTYGRGFQKYGIGFNVRNIAGFDAYNVVSGYQFFNNDVAEISDRGVNNEFGAGTESASGNFLRSA